MFSLPTSETPNNNGASSESQNISVGREINPAERPVTKTIELDKIDAPIVDKIKMDFFPESSNPNAFISEKSEMSKDIISPIGQNTGNIQNPTFINNPSIGGSGGSSQGSREDMRSSANMITTFADAILSNILKFIAKAEDNRLFSLSVQDKKNITEALMDVLLEKKSKMSPTVGLILAMLGAYAFMIPNAVKMRKEHERKFGKIPPIKPPIQPQGKNHNPSNGQQQSQPIKQPHNNIVNVPDNLSVPLKEDDINSQAITPTITYIPPHNGETNPLGYRMGQHWTYPDPNIVCSTRTELQEYLDRGIFPMKIKQKISGKIVDIVYKDNGEPKFVGKPIKRL